MPYTEPDASTTQEVFDRYVRDMAADHNGRITKLETGYYGLEYSADDTFEIPVPPGGLTLHGWNLLKGSGAMDVSVYGPELLSSVNDFLNATWDVANAGVSTALANVDAAAAPKTTEAAPLQAADIVDPVADSTSRLRQVLTGHSPASRTYRFQTWLQQSGTAAGAVGLRLQSGVATPVPASGGDFTMTPAWALRKIDVTFASTDTADLAARIHTNTDALGNPFNAWGASLRRLIPLGANSYPRVMGQGEVIFAKVTGVPAGEKALFVLRIS